MLENITAYLKDHHIQVELVLATAITALARKIIVMPEPTAAVDKPLLVISLGVACLSLCAAYWLVQRSRAGSVPAPLTSFQIR